MNDAAVNINPHGKLQVLQVGNERTPVIIIDDFMEDTSGVIANACAQKNYGPDQTSAYPGLRARLPRSYVIPVVTSVYRLLFQVYKVPAELNLKPVNTVYSLIATPEGNLSLAQRVPHFDSNRPFYLAVLHYLNPGAYCDTGLFRHRPTGYERISEERKMDFMEASRQFLALHGEPENRYIRTSTEHFELYEQIAYRPNRLVVYPGNLLHSGLVDPEVDIDPNPATGRLTANIFLDFFAQEKGGRRAQ